MQCNENGPQSTHYSLQPAHRAYSATTAFPTMNPRTYTKTVAKIIERSKPLVKLESRK